MAPAGHVLLSVDYSQIELRLVADIAGLASMRAAFRDGVDIHAQTASEVFGLPLADMDGETRRKAKAINFGIIYGISGFGLARQLGVPQAEARAYIDTYFERYPGIREYMEDIRVLPPTWLCGNTFRPAGAHSGYQGFNPARRGFSERAAINAPIQGTAADIIKRAMIRAAELWRRPTCRRACCCKFMMNCCSRSRRTRSKRPPRWSARLGIRRRAGSEPVGAADRRRGDRRQLGGGALIGDDRPGFGAGRGQTTVQGG